MASLIKANGEVTDLKPKGKTFVFKGELYPLLETEMIELVTLIDGRFMLIDEDAKIRRGPLKPVNVRATTMLQLSGGMPGDKILGDVVVCERQELQTDEEDGA